MGKGFLITGGTGFIASHTVVELFNFLIQQEDEKDFRIIMIDNYSNSDQKTIENIHRTIENHESRDKIKCYNEMIDIREISDLEKVFMESQESGYKIQYVIHFAGLKSVGESQQIPITYYDNNVVGSLNLIKTMNKYDCHNMIFSSSATVYGDSDDTRETNLYLNTKDTYGQTKLTIELMIRDCGLQFNKDRQFIILRYFNPCGAHPKGHLGESPNQIPNNLFPFVQDVVIKKRPQLVVFGSDFKTADGTGVRDYIHILDLARGHISAIRQQLNSNMKPYDIINLGTGIGHSVLDVITTYQRVSGQEIKYVIGQRRDGDCDSKVADPTKAFQLLGWKTQLGLEDMCRDSYRFIRQQ